MILYKPYSTSDTEQIRVHLMDGLTLLCTFYATYVI